MIKKNLGVTVELVDLIVLYARISGTPETHTQVTFLRKGLSGRDTMLSFRAGVPIDMQIALSGHKKRWDFSILPCDWDEEFDPEI